MIRKAPFLVGLAMLAGCGLLEIQQDPGPRETPIVLKRDDSAAIIELKQSLGGGGGNIMDWVRTVSDSDVTVLEIQNPRGLDIRFPSKGLENIESIYIHYGGEGGGRVLGMERFHALTKFGFSGGNGFVVWPKGFFAAKSIKVLNVSRNGFDNVPDSISAIDSLAEVYFNGNNLREIPLFLMALARIKVFDAVGNKICAPTSQEKAWLDTRSPNWNLQNCP